MEELSYEIQQPINIKSWCQSKKYPIILTCFLIIMWPLYNSVINQTMWNFMNKTQ